MAAINPFSLLRSPLALRALATIRPSKVGIFNPPTQLLFHNPLHFRRAMSSVSATNDEEASAKAATVIADTGAPTIFDKIIAKEIPSTIVYEDEKVLAFRDINPQAPIHVVIIPKSRDGLTQLGKAEARHGDILGHLLYAAKIVAEKEGIVDGFRVVINNGPAAFVRTLTCRSLHCATHDAEHARMISNNGCKGGYNMLENSHQKPTVLSGCFPIYVGEEHRKYVILVKCLSSIRLLAFLNQFEEEIVASEEPITLPCSPKMFEAVLSLAKAS